MDFDFLGSTLVTLCAGIPLTLELAGMSIAAGAVLAVVLAVLRLGGNRWVAGGVQAYVFAFRGTPLLVQIFLLYYGLSQFAWIRHGVLWPFLREPFWCSILALSLNTAAYGSEIIRGGILSVPYGQIEAARACGMSSSDVFRRIIFPIAVRQALPAYSNEIVAMIKSTSLASVITMMEITGIAYKLISDTYRAVEVFVCAGLLYLSIILVITRVIQFVEYRMTPHLRRPVEAAPPAQVAASGQ